MREMAARARRLVAWCTDALTSTRLTEFAEELEARAAAVAPPAQTVSHAEAGAVQCAEDRAAQP
jgi:hypothetical protein